MASATIRIVPNGAAVVHVGDMSFSFSSVEEARDFCVLCDYTWSITVAPLALKPPRGWAP